MVTFLTKTGGLLGPIISVLGYIMNGIYEFFNLFGIQNIALTIIIFTFFVKALMLPLTIKQQKSTKLTAVMNPELQKIQAKYKGKKDETSIRKQQEETQAVYQKYGANPAAGCLPLLIMLPIMFALYRVIYNIPAYVNHVYDLYEYLAIQVQAVGGQGVLITLTEGLKNVKVTADELTSTNAIIDVLKNFNSNTWKEFATSFPDIQNNIVNGDSLTVAEVIKNIQNVNGFFGLNITNNPGISFPAIIIPILAGVLQFIQSKQVQVKNADTNKDNPLAASMNSMNIVMPIMSAFFCITFPIGIGIYWIASSVFAIIQQFFVNIYMDKVDVNDLIQKNLSKKSKNNNMQSKGITMADLAKTQVKNIEPVVKEKQSNPVKEDIQKKAENISTSTNPKSISEIANLLNNRNEKGDK